MRWFRNFSQKNRSTGNCADDVLTIPIFRQEKERPDAPQRPLLHERRSVLFYFLFCQKHHDLITSLYKCRHLFRIQRLVRQNRQII